MAHTIAQFLHTFLDTTQSWKYTLLQEWPTIMGNLHHKVTIKKITDDALILGVYDACWMQELYMLSSVIMHKVNGTLDQQRIKHVRFIMVEPTIQKKNKKIDIQQVQPLKIILSAQEKAALKQIKDPALQKVLEAFLIRCYKEK